MTKTMIPAGMSEKLITTVDAPSPKNRTMPNRGYGPGFRSVRDGLTSHQELDRVWGKVRGSKTSKTHDFDGKY